MSRTARWIGVVAVVLAVAVLAGWWFAGRGTTDAPEPATEPAPERPAEDAVEPAAPIPMVEEEAEPQATSEPSETASITAAFPKRTRDDVGPGRIYGEVVMPEDTPMPADMRVTLRSYDNDAALVSFDTEVERSATPDAEGNFDFRELPLGRYALYATSAGYTMQTTSSLTPRRRERREVLRVVPGGTVSGRVVNEAREPVEGARVFTAGWDISGQERFAPRSRAVTSQVVTDADGTFVMRHLRQTGPGDQGYRLAVKAEGYATYLSEYLTAGTQGVEFVLTRGGVVNGQLVHRGSGAPGAEKTVALASELAVERLHARSDAEGWFFMAGVPDGAHTLRLIDEELVVVPETATFSVQDGAAAEELVVQVARGGVIRGRVYDVDTETGIAGVDLMAGPVEHSLPQSLSAQTDAEGRYQFAGLPPGTYLIGYRNIEGYPEPRSTDDGERLVTANYETETSGVDFGLSRGLRILGRVVDEDGRPVSNAMVYANAYRGGRVNDHDVTGEDGRFEVAGFQPFTEVNVSARKGGHAALEAEPPNGRVQLEDTDLSGVRFVLGAEASISGKIVDRYNQPKAGVQMYARSDSQVNTGSPVERSGADGSIRFEGLGPGEYRLMFSGLRGRWNADDAQTVTVEKGEQVTGVIIRYPEPEGLTISGRVMDTQGEPIGNANIRMTSPGWQDVDTGPDGTYEIAGLEEGVYTLFAASYNHSTSDSVSARAGSSGVNFVLKELAAIEGRVISARTGEAVTAFRVRGEKQGGNSYWVRDEYQAVRDAEGRFRITDVEEGRITVEVQAEGFADASQDIGHVSGGDTRDGVLIRMDDGAVLTGEVVDGNGRGVGRAQLFLGELPDEWRRPDLVRGHSNADGSFRLGSLPGGTVQISAYHREYAPATVTLRLSTTRDNHARVVLGLGGAVEGRVTLNGAPMSGEHVNVHTVGGRDSKSGQTDEDGRYRVAGLSEGTAQVRASIQTGGGSRNQHQQVEIAEGFVAEANFDFEPATSAVEGTVYEAERVPVRGQAYVTLEVLLGDGRTESQGMQLDAGGFVFEQVPAGTAKLRVSANGYPNKFVSFALGEGERVRRDILLYGGGSVRVEVSGTPSVQSGVISVTAINGEFAVNELSTATAQQIQAQSVSSARVMDGLAQIHGLDAGTYTILVIAFDPQVSATGGDPFATADWRSAVVDVEAEQETTVRVAF